MRSPKTFAEFKDLIEHMRPRDRYVFEVIDPSEDWGENLEIYLTFVIPKSGKPYTNLFYQMTDELGKHRLTIDPEKDALKGIFRPEGTEYREGMNKGNKRMSLVTDSYLETIYSWIKI